MRGKFVRMIRRDAARFYDSFAYVYDSANGWHICVVNSPAKNIGAIRWHRTILFAMALHVNSIMSISGPTLCVWRSSLHTIKYPCALHKNAVANGTFKQISTCSCEFPVARISSKPRKCRSYTIVSTKSSRVLECWRTSDSVPNKLSVDDNLPFTIRRI